MGIKIKFDESHLPQSPTLILANKNGEKLGEITARNIMLKDCLNAASEISFNVYKKENNNKNHLWDLLVDYRLVWCKEWDTWFEIKIEISESKKTLKTVYGTQLGQAELSQIKLYNVEINTEDDIARDDYENTVLWQPNNSNASLLHRILEKAPHYSIEHVDSTIASIQRTFSFDDISIYDAFQEIGKEIGCLFIFNSNSNENGNIKRTISVYDLQSNCNECNYRGEFVSSCPKCGSNNINDGYGEDTAIFVTSDELAEDIKLTTDNNSVKNCFKLEGGDDLMTATIRSCNPNGTDYIWYITEETKKRMSNELVEKLNSYNALYEYYQKNHITVLDTSSISEYNSIVNKYKTIKDDIQSIPSSIVGYPSLIMTYYDTIDFNVFLESTLMPSINYKDTSAIIQSQLLTTENISPVAVFNIKTISLATANNAVLSVAKTIVDNRYQVKIQNSNLSNNIWVGNFIVTNYSDDTDTVTTSNISIAISDDYEAFVTQKVDKSLHKNDNENLNVTGLFSKPYSDFRNELKNYSLDMLNSFYNICQSCIEILIEQGIGDKNTWIGSNPNLYNSLYMQYTDKLNAIQSEIHVRQHEINVIVGTYDIDNTLISSGVQNYIINEIWKIQNILKFDDYLGEDLWLELCSYRREDKYSNSNYISDGLNNAELFQRALEFIDIANNEIFKSAELQHSISSTLKNLLVIEKFKLLTNSFEVGNWIRSLIDDKIFKLRLIEYEIDFDNLNNISVEFSDVLNVIDGISDIENILSKANSMSSSYDTVKHQASQGSKTNDVLSNWVDKGLDASNVKIIGGADNQSQTWDSHGMLFRKYNPITDSYDDEQSKIINSSYVFTSDNWKTVKTAIGGFYYFHPVTGELTYAYGINGETIIGKLILGENLGIHNNSGSLQFDDNGLIIKNDTNSFSVNPNSSTLLSISKNSEKMFWVDENGMLHISGDGAGLDITTNSSVTNKVSKGDVSSQLSIETGAVSMKSNRVTIESDNFKLSGSGIINAKGTLETGDENGIHTKLDGSSLCMYNSLNVEIGEYTSTYQSSSPEDYTKYGIAITTNAGNINLGVLNGSKTDVYYYMNNGTNPDNLTERHLFRGDIRFLQNPRTSGIYLMPSSASLDESTFVRLYESNYDGSPSTISSGGFYANGSLGCSGTKYRVVDTEHYGIVGMNAFETTGAYFSDIGSGYIDEDKCYVYLDNVFLETIDQKEEYHVMITRTSEEEVTWVEKKQGYFIVHGEKNASFDWMVIAKQKCYQDNRMNSVILEHKEQIPYDDSIFYYDNNMQSENYMNQFKDTIDENAIQYVNDYNDLENDIFTGGF